MTFEDVLLSIWLCFKSLVIVIRSSGENQWILPLLLIILSGNFLNENESKKACILNCYSHPLGFLFGLLKAGLL